MSLPDWPNPNIRVTKCKLGQYVVSGSTATRAVNMMPPAAAAELAANRLQAEHGRQRRED